jgi:hypothetical protein
MMIILGIIITIVFILLIWSIIHDEFYFSDFDMKEDFHLELNDLLRKAGKYHED